MSQQTSAQTALVCSQCGRSFAQSDLVQIAGNWVCGDCKPAFLSRVMAGGAAVSPWDYAGFWVRVGAQMIDGITLGIVQASAAFLFFGTFGAQFLPGVTRSAPVGVMMGFQLFTYATAIAYYTLFLHYRGATPGKMALGLKVIRSDGSPLGWGVSIGRYFMYLVSGLILGIGYFMAGFDKEKRALHDRVCDTRVVYKGSLA